MTRPHLHDGLTAAAVNLVWWRELSSVDSSALTPVATDQLADREAL